MLVDNSETCADWRKKAFDSMESYHETMIRHWTGLEILRLIKNEMDIHYGDLFNIGGWMSAICCIKPSVLSLESLDGLGDEVQNLVKQHRVGDAFQLIRRIRDVSVMEALTPNNLYVKKRHTVCEQLDLF